MSKSPIHEIVQDEEVVYREYSPFMGDIINYELIRGSTYYWVATFRLDYLFKSKFGETHSDIFVTLQEHELASTLKRLKAI